MTAWLTAREALLGEPDTRVRTTTARGLIISLRDERTLEVMDINVSGRALVGGAPLHGRWLAPEDYVRCLVTNATLAWRNR